MTTFFKYRTHHYGGRNFPCYQNENKESGHPTKLRKIFQAGRNGNKKSGNYKSYKSGEISSAGKMVMKKPDNTDIKNLGENFPDSQDGNDELGHL